MEYTVANFDSLILLNKLVMLILLISQLLFSQFLLPNLTTVKNLFNIFKLVDLDFPYDKLTFLALMHDDKY